MANKFLSDINLTARLQANGQSGSSGQILSSTGTGVEWIDNVSSSSDSNLVYFDVKNSTGSTISKGKGVMAVGTDGNSGHILIDEMVGDGTIEPKYFLGVLEEDIANGQTGRVISFGMISQFDTRGQNGETWADGDILWCDPVNAGDFTITEPDGPNVKIAAAIILNSSTNGKIQIRVQANEGIHDLHDTKITSQVDGDVLVWNDTDGVWFNDSTLNVDYTAGRVGIGTTSPGTFLQLGSYGVSGRYLDLINYPSTPSEHMLHITAPSTTGRFGGGISFGEQTFSAANIVARDAGSLGALDLCFGTGNSSSGVTERIRINNDGTVGIGPNALDTAGGDRLHVDGTLRVGAYFSINDRDFIKLVPHGTDTKIISPNERFHIENTDGDIILNAAGNVGIGTTSPGTKLEVAGTIRSKGDNSKLELLSQAINGNNWNLVSDDTGHFNLYEGTTSRLRVLDGGNVGIGTTSPSQKLDVNGNAYISGQAQASTAVIKTYSGHAMFGSNSTAEPIALGRDAANLDLVVATNGNVGIGTSDPGAKLHVNGSAMFSPVSSTTPTLDLVSFNGSSDPFTRYYDESNGPSWCTGLDVSDEKYKISFDYDGTSVSTSTKLTIDTAGKVGIGTTNPRSKLDVAGGVRIANDSAAASALNVGTLRYRTSGNNSYVDMCMQTGASTYAWVNIVQNNW